ncbi:iron (III)-transporter permease HitB [Salinibacterium xinjiangense]|uniref:Iron(III) transport system permease protein n=1 Tax=Salinibacterium xinjiangense TaxID=386302 RepID=A0A2C8YR27_9MICO|nr:iron ABC transporter permease [Salinibacterium xinjiangense]GGK98470.1 iron (III)-transporter permease HitB [Salinibacterium xinjiangense]SOE53022.1 iron(III) transport system permease protein [Salinibacterium xinjiangense]
MTEHVIEVAAPPVGSRRPPPALLALAILACAVSAIPLVYLLVRVSGGAPDEIASILARPRMPALLLNTVSLVVTVTLSSLVLGMLTAFLLVRVRLRAQRVWIVLAALPLAVPSYLAAFGWLALIPGMQGFWGSFFLLTIVSTPYVTLPVAAAIRGGTTGLDDVARTLGHGPWRAFWLGTWPQIRPAALAGSLLVALYVLSEFGAVALMRYPVLTTAIQQAYGASFNRNYAAILAIILVAIAMILVFGEQRARGRVRRQFGAVTGVSRVRMVSLRAARIPSYLLLAVVPTCAVGIPVSVLVGRLLQAETLRELDVLSLGQAIANTLGLALGGAVTAVLLAIPIAALAARYRGRVVRAIESTGYLALGLPGIVVGLSLVFFSLAVIPALYQTAIVLTFAYGVLFMPKAIGAIRSSVAQVPESLSDVARTLGYSRWQTWRHVTVRLARPGIMAGAMLVAVTAMKELPATLLLRPTGTNTLATELWARTDVSAYGAAAPYAAALVLVASVPAFLLSGARRGRTDEVPS